MSRHAGSRGGPAVAPPLIETKLAPPRGRPTLVVRPRLVSALDGLSSTALTLVNAPVGFGKTVLAQSWGETSGSSVAWISIDAADDDPVRLWTYVATAIDRIRPGLGRNALSRLSSGVPPETAVDELVNGIDAFGEPLALVLDDLHSLTSEPCLRSFEHAVERLPRNARILATTRSDPPIALARLRARGALGEIRARELAFTLDETRELVVVREQIALDDADVEMLVDRTEGWPAGLYLAVLWLRTLGNPRTGVRDFHGNHRHVADYLTGEVLDTLDADTKDFLVRTSVLGRFNGALCDHVLARQGSAKLIAELERSNLFLIALDPQGEWFRYHHLFGELLRLELGYLDGTAAVELHRRASEWCRAQGLVDEALEHAHAAGDDSTLAEMLVDTHRDLFRSGRHATLVRWITLLPSEEILDHSVLAPVAAVAHAMDGGDLAERRRLLALAEQVRVERASDWTPYHEVGLGLARGVAVEDDLPAALESARRTAELARQDEDVATAALANLATLMFLDGDHAGARETARAALERPEAPARPHGHVHALATIALAETEAGRVEDGVSTARQSVSAAREAGIGETGAGGLAHVALARALAVSGQLPEAEREAVVGERLRRRADPDATHVYASFLLAEIRARRGQLSRAHAELERANGALASYREPGGLREAAARAERAVDDARAATFSLEEPPTIAELSVLRLLAGDKSQREIGSELYLSINTVKTHARSLYRKLGVTSREAAVTRAAALGLLDDENSPG